MKSKSLSAPNKLPIEGLTIIFFKALYKWGRALWPFILIYIFKSSKYQAYQEYILLGVGVILILSIIHAILFYKHFSFQIKDNEFIVKRGYLNKEYKSIPLERIQTVNIKQNFIQQIIGVVQLDIDTAGSKEKEISLPALRLAHAKEIESFLLSQKENTDEDTAEKSDSINKEASHKEEKKTLFKLSIPELAKIAISDNILKGGLLALSFTYGLYEQYNDIITERFAKEIDTMKETADSASWQLILFAIGIFIVFSIVISVIRIILINFDLKLSKTSQGYKLEKGLFNKKSVIIPLSKIQTYTWTTNPIRKLFNIVTVTIKQASSNAVDEKNAVHIPGCKNSIEENIRKEIFNNSDYQDYSTYRTQAFYFIRSWFFLVLLPSALIPFFTGLKPILIGILAWDLLITYMLYKASLKRQFSISKDYIIAQKGAISTTWKLVPLYKIQAVSFKQSIFMKRKDRASLRIYTASESFIIPYINTNTAMECYNFILYKIESKNRKWM